MKVVDYSMELVEASMEVVEYSMEEVAKTSMETVERSMDVVEAFGRSGSFQVPRIPERGRSRKHLHGRIRDAAFSSTGFHQLPSSPSFVHLRSPIITVCTSETICFLRLPSASMSFSFGVHQLHNYCLFS